ncbi:DNA-binding transcriptional regulator, AcrR family [Mucilaginibacter gossypiicola]|uniref:DNA-binding transcriptional regulator, AcrR family n=1 Tax=Mucilaginibacter gossypiicola TaxID=551995 RepID=A0A1H8KJY6_9SPHI|nr:TetR/AcrR family transcriptional regulator [Mucilaginibacter gossypiicola]SEN93185.1 DNA-binding transcriptional regulator, AcrR family [Mucilaginibacter gossypiicola]
MGSKERILRQKDDTRRKILDAALDMIKCEGCDALSMRKLAEHIEYTAPAIYEYFENKDALYVELARNGHLKLVAMVKIAKDAHTGAVQQMEAMWLAYWSFAITYKELYQLMFAVGTGCCPVENQISEAKLFPEMVSDVIRMLYLPHEASGEEIQKKYYTYWAIIHGLIAINMIQLTRDEKMNQEILIDAIKGINALITG